MPNALDESKFQQCLDQISQKITYFKNRIDEQASIDANRVYEWNRSIFTYREWEQYGGEDVEKYKKAITSNTEHPLTKALNTTEQLERNLRKFYHEYTRSESNDRQKNFIDNCMKEIKEAEKVLNKPRGFLKEIFEQIKNALGLKYNIASAKILLNTQKILNDATSDEQNQSPKMGR